MGDSVFGSMTIDLLSKDSTISLCNLQITEQDYEKWKQQFCWEALQGCRFGEGFCLHFNTTDNILLFERDIDRAEQYIRTHYISA